MMELVPLLSNPCQSMGSLDIHRPSIFHIDHQLSCGQLFGDLHQVKQSTAYLFCAANFAFRRKGGSQQPFETHLCGPEGQLVVNGVEGYLFLFDIAGLPDADVIAIFFKRVNADLFFLFTYHFRLLIYEIKVLEEFHLLVNYFQSQSHPQFLTNGEVVDPSANCIAFKVLNLSCGCSSSERQPAMSPQLSQKVSTMRSISLWGCLCFDLSIWKLLQINLNSNDQNHQENGFNFILPVSYYRFMFQFNSLTLMQLLYNYCSSGLSTGLGTRLNFLNRYQFIFSNLGTERCGCQVVGGRKRGWIDFREC